MFKAASRPASRAALAFAVLSATFSPGARADPLPEIVVTADRVEEPIGQTGASVTVIPASEVQKLGTKGLADVLRGVAGLDVDEAGGVGSVTQVRLRGANPGETLVLIDGVRIGNPTATDGSLDFGDLSAVDVDRIEILRGPQSALYGSDAMGGVINIITRKGAKTPRRNVTVEAGSYGTLSTRATLSGGDDVWTYSLGVNLLHSDGFPRYGYRIDRPLYDGAGDPIPDYLLETLQADPAGRFADLWGYGGPSELDGFRGFARVGHEVGDGSFELLTVKPGALALASGAIAAPHIDVSLFARGLLHRCVTRFYFADEAAANAADPVLATVPPARRETLLAQPVQGGYEIDIHLQGPGETVFFAL